VSFGGERRFEMDDFSRRRKAVAAGGALAVLGLVIGVVLHTTGTPGLVAAQEKAKDDAPSLPIFAAGFVTAEGKLARAGGGKHSVKRMVVDKAFKGGRVEYQVVFGQELSSVPVVVATGDGRYELNVNATKKGFTVSFWDAKERVSRDSDFNFIVVKVSEINP
jgi:hypothetical protein